ncbi:MAG: zinc ribbon domain-containing protein [Candidatus Hodarchaeota archaeon]
MANEGTPSTLVIVAVILQFILTTLFAAGTAFLYSLLPLIGMIPPAALPPGMSLADVTHLMTILTIALGVVTVLSLVFAIIWIFWRKEPSKHRVALIVTGVVAAALAGFLPGLFAIIAGATAEKKPEVSPIPTAKSPTPTKGVLYCSSCGAAVSDPSAQFCGICGAKIN